MSELRVNSPEQEQENNVPNFASIASILESHDVTTLDAESMQRVFEKNGLDGLIGVVVWHIKETNAADVDEVGAECFGDAWEEGRWL